MNILIVLLVIIAIPFIAALFTPKGYTVEREVAVNRPRQEVFNYIKLLGNQLQYNKWVMEDPKAKRADKGIDGTVGFVTAWESDNKNVGKGAQEIKKLADGERMDLEIRFEKPFKATSTAYMSTTGLSEGQTKVKWSLSGDRNYMMKVMHILLNLKKMLGKDIDTSLNNLKSVLEK